MTSGQLSYDLRRLHAHGIIRRVPRSRTYKVISTGIEYALFLAHLAQRFLIPGLAQITDPDPPADSRLRAASRAYRAAIHDLAQQAHLTACIPNRPPQTGGNIRLNMTRSSKPGGGWGIHPYMFVRGVIRKVQSNTETMRPRIGQRVV
ncbi:hypothetical protein [Nonomuraea sp. NPDC050786]|uniref:hypothetical protein n=1 Tax=Nonomuraea sp. NPDC050786 TaxID=3154840 RepID=UPI0033F11B88